MDSVDRVRHSIQEAIIQAAASAISLEGCQAVIKTAASATSLTTEELTKHICKTNTENILSGLQCADRRKTRAKQASCMLMGKQVRLGRQQCHYACSCTVATTICHIMQQSINATELPSSASVLFLIHMHMFNACFAASAVRIAVGGRLHGQAQLQQTLSGGGSSHVPGMLREHPSPPMLSQCACCQLDHTCSAAGSR